MTAPTDPASLKVLHIVGSLNMGGAERWMLELVRYWQGHPDGAPRFDFLATSGEPGLLDDEFRAMGCQIFYLRYSRRTLLAFIRRFRRILRDGGYAALHDHQGWVSGWHFLMGAGVLPSVRIAHAHNTALEIGDMSADRRFLAAIGRALIPCFATRITGASRDLLTAYGLDAAPFARIPRVPLYCGLDPDRFRGDRAAMRASVHREFSWPPDSRIILFVGRIDDDADVARPRIWKNSTFALSVGLECARRDACVRMLFAGAFSPAVPSLARRVETAGLAGRIVFADVRQDIERLMLASDALLFPSRAEGLGMAAVEAQAAGLPVLASTAVPRECVVVPSLYHALSLDEPAKHWADKLMEILAMPRLSPEQCHNTLARSDFAIANSARHVMDAYRAVA